MRREDYLIKISDIWHASPITAQCICGPSHHVQSDAYATVLVRKPEQYKISLHKIRK